ncbi:type II and III secretion system protein [Hyphomicrobium denitrificans ATCC 51888]|uniref:Type II and III secretion system protein n=1 Tax=Hyphomicrobium denitrificans (strain ATCC 51888 / DSM 1869 / NCIMB 11706 / TK 0415) TaxID=582899 RepID=D8JQZ2_HYPDA|nr:type II and III secretion system protein family protein [Hyphomicrobium denitrificans]ADJ22144.1 type II and III secretion system protein [Hyphomicrobium denitrificans ATCC 51888]
MRSEIGFPWRAAARAIMVFAAVLTSAAPTSAQSRAADRLSVRADRGDPEFSKNTQSIVRISESEGLPVRKSIKIGLGKSVLIEFPNGVRDVMASNPAVVDAVVLSSNRVFLLGKAPGQSNAFFFSNKGEQLALIELNVDQEGDGLEMLLRRVIPGSEIKVETLNQTAILTGRVKSPSDSARASRIAAQFMSQMIANWASNVSLTSSGSGQQNKAGEVKDADDVKSVINLLTVEAEEQVMLKVTVAEVKRTLLKQLGINLGGVLSSGSFSTTLLTENAFPISTAQGLGSLPTFGVGTAASAACAVGQICAFNPGPATGAFGNSGLVSGWGNSRNNIQSAVRALERDGLIKTLAEPNLTAISGEPAEFLAGGEVPYVTGVDTQTGVSAVAFKKFGVQLAFTPVVLTEGRISLKIDTSVSDISQYVAGNPVFDTRQAKTVVELPSGGSLALAGLISTKTQQNIDGLPGAKDIPILGTLFRSRDFQNDESELVVIVTPYLVQPVARQQLSAPTDGLYPATDLKADFLGHLNRIYGKSEVQPSGGLKGDYGFIVE